MNVQRMFSGFRVGLGVTKGVTALLAAITLAMPPVWALAPASSQASWQGAPASSSGQAFQPQIQHTTLASGQQVYVQEIHTQPIVTVDTWVNTGSAQETAENNGVSHFLEHLLFKGTKRYGVGEIDRILESRGAEFNAATSDDFTHYHITTAAPYFQEALNLHAEMLLNATINPPELTRERKVVQEEINRSLDNPGRKAYIAMARLLFGTHPYAMDTLGPKANIQNLSREAILDYYHRWYQPENFKTMVVGDVNAQDAILAVNEAFQKAYEAQPRPEAGKPKMYPVAPVTTPQSAVVEDPNVSAVQWQLAFMAPPIENRQANYALDIAAIILGQGASSRLNRQLKEEKQLVSEIAAANGTQQQAGVFYVGAQVKPENRDAAAKAILQVVEDFKKTGPTPEELQKAKTQVVKQFAFSTESTEGVASSIGYNVTIGTLEDYTDYVSNIQKITADQVLAASRQYLNPQQAVLVEVVPTDEADKSAGNTSQKAVEKNIALLKSVAQESMAVQPATGSAPVQMAASEPASARAVEKVTLPNGTVVLLKPSKTTQTVALSLFAKGGRLVEPKPGVAGLTARMLMKGTRYRTAEQLAEELERLGLSIGASADEDYLQVTAASVSDDFPRLMTILEDVLVNPTFPQDKLTKEKAEALEEIKTSRDQPGSLMFEKLTEALYPTHPYGAIGKRVEAALPGITQADIRQFYMAQVQPKNLVISVVGNFDADLVKQALRRLEDELPANKTAPKSKASASQAFPEVPPLKENVVVEAQKPEQAATWLAYGWLAPGISTSRDYITLKVINTMLGSGLSSRLFVNLREKQGLAYHVSSMFPSTLKKGRFVMYIGTDPRNQAQVKRGFDQEIARLKTEPVSAEELETVKSKLIGAFALAHESNASQAFYLGLYETLGVGYQFDKNYPELIARVTPEDIQRVANTYFSQSRVVAVVAPKTVRTEQIPEAPAQNPQSAQPEEAPADGAH